MYVSVTVVHKFKMNKP